MNRTSSPMRRRASGRGSRWLRGGRGVVAAESMELLEARLFLSAAPAPAYATAASVAVGGTPSAVVTDDFNQDGNEDFAIAQGGSNSVAVVLGNGDGTFAAPVEFPTGADPTSIAIGDFNDDGVDDLVTADSGSGDVSVLLGRSDSNGDAMGSFGSPHAIHVEPPGGGPMSVAVGSFTADGNPDIAFAGPQGLYVLLGNGAGTFSLPHLVAAGNFSGGVVADTFAQSGNTDLAALDPATGTVEVFAGNGDGTFAGPASYAVGAGASSIASGDFRQEGTEDIAVTLPSANAVSVLLQSTTTRTVSIPTAASTAGGNSTYSYTTGTGAFGSPITIRLDQSPASLFLDDVNGDGNLDIVTANPADNSLSVIPGNGDGTFGAPAAIAVGKTPVAAAVGDFVGDGGQDLVSANNGNGAASIVMEQTSDVGVSLSASAPYAVLGSNLTYTATITNSGPGSATGVSFDDFLPSNFTLVSATSTQGTVDTTDPTNISVAIPELADGVTDTITLVAKATQYGPASDDAWVSTDSINSSYENANASVSTPVTGASGAEVALTSDTNRYFWPIAGPVGVAPVALASSSTGVIGLPIGFGGARVGQDYTYTFTVTNYGPESATGLDFTDTLPAGVKYVASSASQGSTDAGVSGTVSAELGTLADGASATVSITIVPSAVGSITDAASLSSTSTNPYPAGAALTLSTYVYSDTTPIPLPVLDTGGSAPAGKSGPLPTLSVSSVRQTDVTRGKTDFVFTVTRSGDLSSASAVKYSTASGTAKAGVDFQSVSGELTFAAGASSATVSVPVIGSKKHAADKSFALDLTSPSDAMLKKSRAIGTIVSAVAAKNPFARAVGINFEPAGGPIVAGYLADTGSALGAGGDGLTYGWSTDNSAHAVARQPAKSGLYDTFNVLGAGGASSWQIDLPDGRYSLRLAAGDPSNTTNTYQVDANGVQVLSGSARRKHLFISGQATVSVTDGALALTVGSGVSFDDLDFLKLKFLGALA